MSSSPPPHPPYENPTDISRFDDLQTYAHTYGTYLLQISQYRMFEMAYSNSQTLNLSLSQFTVPIANRNIEAIRRLRSLQILNLRLANDTYDRVVTPHLLLRINQEHHPERLDSPTPMRILSPPGPTNSRSLSPFVEINPVITNRINQRRRCYKCRSHSHVKRHCPRYRCQTCRRLQPGHLTHDCPDQPMTNDHEYDFGHDFDPDSNLNGEQ